jgi:hypothetical protein
LSCSAPLADNSAVLKITAIANGGSDQAVFLRAGKDTSEWSWERSDVRSVIRHSRATVFDTFPSVDAHGSGFNGHHFVGIVAVPAMVVRELRLEWVGNAGVFSLQRLSLTDEISKRSYGVTHIIPAGAHAALLDRLQFSKIRMRCPGHGSCRRSWRCLQKGYWTLSTPHNFRTGRHTNLIR